MTEAMSVKQRTNIDKEADEDIGSVWRDMPVFTASCGAGIAVILMQMVNYRRYRRNKMPTSIFIQQTRVYAQGLLVFALMGGAGWNVYKSYMQKKEREAKKAAEAGTS